MNVKTDLIQAYFDDLVNKTSFAADLYERGRTDEALILCCAYITGLGNQLYWPAKADRENFSRLLVEHGGQELLRLVHPRALLDALRGRCKPTANALEPHLQLAPAELLTDEELFRLAEPHLPEEHFELLRSVWLLGTLASIAYKRFRNPTAHRGRAPEFLSFDQTKFGGQSVPELGFPILRAALQNATTATRELSLRTGKWFGHDCSNAG